VPDERPDEPSDQGRTRWRDTTRRKAVEAAPERRNPFETSSGLEVKDLYTPADTAGLDEDRDLGRPGEPPFTRGVQATMYRSRLWTMRQYAGFSTASETNKRFRYLLEQGQTGLSVAFDLPTQMGYDSDAPEAEGEVGRVGVPISSLADMETLVDGIPLGKVSTSMTINATAATLVALYVAAAEKQGVERTQISGTVQNDILKEYIARGTWIYPPGPSMRLVTDVFEFGARELPKWNTISISGYHMREAGATAAQELAFTLADAIAYCDAAIARGMAIDDFAPRLSFFFAAHNDLFEEVAKFRAARRMYSRLMRERFGASDASCRLRFHTQTGGVTLQAQQPLNNVVRVAVQALAAVLGGTQSLHTNGYDEALSLPTAEAATLALRTQQIIAEESGVAQVADPLGGSYFVERLTDQMEEAAMAYIQKIDELGGIVRAVEDGYPQREIANSAYQFQRQVDTRQRSIVGVNKYVDKGEADKIPTLKIDSEVERSQIERMKKRKSTRDRAAAERALDAVKRAAAGDANLVEAVLEAVKKNVTIGEVSDVFRQVWGEHRDPAYL